MTQLRLGSKSLFLLDRRHHPLLLHLLLLQQWVLQVEMVGRGLRVGYDPI
jgi:hypothetical protein